jgi:phage terminase small subunit
MAKLTPKQQAFCEEYLIDLNATQAAIRAGYKADNARQVASENLSKVDIADKISELQAKRSAKTEITAEWVLKGIKANTLKAEQDDNLAMAFKGYELGGRHLKMFTDKQELTGANGGPIQTDSVFEFIPVGNDK